MADRSGGINANNRLLSGILDWSCGRCTYLNDKNRTICEMCGNRRGDITTPHPTQSPDKTATGLDTPGLDVGSLLSTRSETRNPTRGNPYQVALVSSTSTTASNNEPDLELMRRELQQTERELERRRSENERNRLRQRLRDVRAELQQYDNSTPPTTGPTASGVSVSSSVGSSAIGSNPSDDSILVPSVDREQTRVKVPYPDNDWICNRCTLRNVDLVQYCAACEAPRDDTVHPSSEERQHTSENPETFSLRIGDSLISSNQDYDNTSTTSTEQSMNPDISQLRWEVEDLEGRLNRARRGNSGGGGSEEIQSLLSRLQIASRELQNSEHGDSNPREPTSHDTANRTNATPSIPDTDSNNLRIVLIGATGTGKSSTGNTILAKNAFDARLSAASVTKISRMDTAYRFNRLVTVVDTPGIFDTDADPTYITTEILKCIGMTTPGPHAVLLVVSVSERFTDQNKRAVEFFVSHFGVDLYKYLIVVFTKKDDLEKNNMTIETYLERIPESLENLLSRCSNNYIAFNNGASNAEKDVQVQNLLQQIDYILQRNSGEFFTNEVYNETDRKIKKRMNRIYKQLDKERMNRIKNIRHEQTALLARKYQQLCAQQQRATGRNLTPAEQNALRETATRETQTIIRQRIDAVDGEMRPQMRRTVLRTTAQREIEAERPGTMQRLRKGAVKALKVLGGGVIGAISSPFVALAGAIGVVAAPIIGGVTAAMSDESD